MAAPTYGERPETRRGRGSKRDDEYLYAPRRSSSKVYPLDPPPRNLTLPFYFRNPDKYGKYLEYDSNTRGGIVRGLRVQSRKPIVPGWLIELKPRNLNAILGIKEVIKTHVPTSEYSHYYEGEEGEPTTRYIINELHRIIRDKLGIPIVREEVCNVLEAIPPNCRGGHSFPHFMFIMGNPSYAKRFGYLRKDPDREGGCKKMDYTEFDGEGADEYPERVHSEETVPEFDSTGYSRREKLFYSGLLITQMYSSIKEFNKLYFTIIPRTRKKEIEKLKTRCLYPDTPGMKKRGWAAWDCPPPLVPKVSPYLANVPFVTRRWMNIEKTEFDGRKRKVPTSQALHLFLETPKDKNGPIRIVENRRRIKEALVYLASKGDVLALLPDVQFIIHMSDTFLDKLEEDIDEEEIQRKKWPKLNKGAELNWIIREARKIYQPFVLPEQIGKLKLMIRYNDGILLRNICECLRKQHWGTVVQVYLDYREKVWQLLHVEQIAPGALRNSFTTLFVTYLPFQPQLPILISNPSTL